MKFYVHSVGWAGLAALTLDVAAFQSPGISVRHVAQSHSTALYGSTKLLETLVFGNGPVPVAKGDLEYETEEFATFPPSQLGARGFKAAVAEAHEAATMLENNLATLKADGEDTIMPDGTVMCNSFIEEYTPAQKNEMDKAMKAYMWFSSLHTAYVNQAAASLSAGNDVTIQGVTYKPVRAGTSDNGLTQNAAQVAGPILRWLYTKIKIAYSPSDYFRELTQKGFSAGISTSFVLSVLETVMVGVSPATLANIAKVASGQSGNLSVTYGSDATDLWMSSMVPILYWNPGTDSPNMALAQYRITMFKKAWEVVTSCSSTKYKSTTTLADGLRAGIDLPLLIEIYEQNDQRAKEAEDFLNENSGDTLSDMEDTGAGLDFS